MAGYGLYPGQRSSLTDERSQQVEDLLRQCPGCRPVNPDRTVLDLPVELKDGQATALRITLPPHFPQERPTLSVLIPVISRAVDPSGRLHTSLLNSWVYGSSRLSSVVAEAVAVLTDGAAAPGAAAADKAVPYPAGYPVPQHLQQQQQGPLAHARQQLSGSPPRGKSTSPNRMMQQQQQQMGGPATTSALPDFSRFTAAQLEELMQDAAAFKAVLKDAIQGSPMAATLEEIRLKNRQLAESNLNKQGTINEVRNQLAIVRSSEYTLIKSRFDELLNRQSKVLSTMGGVVWREKLEEAVSATDAAASALCADFMAGDLPLDGFVQQYTEQRAKHHGLDLKRQAAETLLASTATGVDGGAGGGGLRSSA